jgi:hypothetical protein
MKTQDQWRDIVITNQAYSYDDRYPLVPLILV